MRNVTPCGTHDDLFICYYCIEEFPEKQHATVVVVITLLIIYIYGILQLSYVKI